MGWTNRKREKELYNGLRKFLTRSSTYLSNLIFTISTPLLIMNTSIELSNWQNV